MAVISGTNGNDDLLGTATNDIIFGFAGDDRLSGGGGADVLDGGTGADFMDGGAGNDVYYVDNGNDEAKEQSKTAAGGVDHVYASVTYDCYYGIENLTLTGSDQNNAVGNELNNIITGNVSNNQLHGLDGRDELWGEDANDALYGGNGNDLLNGGVGSDLLDGGAGADEMYGDDGDDVYYVDHAGDETTEFVNYVSGGRDRVYASVSHTIGFGMEELVLTGTANINGTGGEGFNLIIGNSGNNILNGGAGADTMEGGAGNDIYVVDHPVDTVKENADGVLGGVDTVRSSVTHTLGFGFENLTLTGPAAINGTGNALHNSIIGNEAMNFLFGGEGDDQLSGNGGLDTLFGGAGDDQLNGGSGGDVLLGEAGSDTANYSTATAGVTVNLRIVGAQDTRGSGIDGLASIENLTGSNFADTLTGDSATNVLSGLAGNDDLDGGAGADSMDGGAGDDTYVVDDVNDTTREVSDDALGGIDRVLAYVSHTLGYGLENLTLLGSAAINGTGNTKANVITGNDADNVLAGLDGDDTLDGGLGADILDGGVGSDTARYYNAVAGVTVNLGLVTPQNTGGAGFDQLVSIENLTGSYFNDTLTGDSASNVLSGLDGDDELNGGAGADIMDGGAGKDTYVVDHIGDMAREVSNNVLVSGVDSVVASVSYTLGYGMDYLYLRGPAALNGTGNENDNFISGNEAKNVLVGMDGSDSIQGEGGDDLLEGGHGNDSLDGGAGADTMIGGNGNDLYAVDDVGDVTTEESDGALGGSDRVAASVSHTLGDGIELLYLVGEAAINGTGNKEDNGLFGNGARNRLLGLDGNDYLDGGAGADTMDGGAGNDYYVVDHVGDVTQESASGALGGSDSVEASVSHTLGQGLEYLYLTGDAAINGTGNDEANGIFGNSADNLLSGLDGNDALEGRNGDDQLDGGDGADRLDGGDGNDSLKGGNGNDYLDGAAGFDGADYRGAAAGVTVNLNQQEGGWQDTVGAGLDTLVGIEDVIGSNFGDTLIGDDAPNDLHGLNGNNAIFGGNGHDRLYGGNDNDFLDGGDGIDTADYFGATAGVTVSIGLNGVPQNTGGSGIDTLVSIENVSGSNYDDTLLGGGGSDRLDGGKGNDGLSGGNGKDILYGGSGADTMSGGGESGLDPLVGGRVNVFYYASVSDSPAGAGDVILDLSFGEVAFGPYYDSIDLSEIDADELQNGNQAFSWLGSNNFAFTKAGQLRYYFGKLEGEVNGDGVVDFEITLVGVSPVELELPYLVL